MTSAWGRGKNEEPSRPAKVAEGKTTAKRGPLNILALISLLIGSLALIWASLPFLKILALILGGFGLVAGILGLAAYSSIGKGKIWSIAGILASLFAVCLSAFALIQAGRDNSSENQLTQVPLRHPMNATGSRGSPDIDSDWVDAGTNAVQQGDVRVRLISITVSPVDFKEISNAVGPAKGTPKTAPKRPREKYVVIKLRISNAGAGRLIQYAGWSGPLPSGESTTPILQDAGGKKYPMKVFPPGREVIGQVANASIPPSKWVDDVLVFEGSPDRVEFLRLELPAGSVGSKGSFRLQIPGRMIASR